MFVTNKRWQLSFWHWHFKLHKVEPSSSEIAILMEQICGYKCQIFPEKLALAYLTYFPASTHRGTKLSKKVWPWNVTVNRSNGHWTKMREKIRHLYSQICYGILHIQKYGTGDKKHWKSYYPGFKLQIFKGITVIDRLWKAMEGRYWKLKENNGSVA